MTESNHTNFNALRRRTFYANINGSYLRAGNNHIFIGPTGIDELDRIKASKHKLAIHIFIVDIIRYSNKKFHDSIVSALNRFNEQCKINIHIPKQCSDMKVVMDKLFEDIKDPRLKIFCEKKGPYFSVSHENDDEFNIVYGDKKIDVIIKPASWFMMDTQDTRAVQNSAQKDNPELFKDKIIANFKANTPLKILKSFKDEDDIWDFIKEQGYWSPDVEASGSKNTVTLTLPEGVDPETMVVDSVRNAAQKLGLIVK